MYLGLKNDLYKKLKNIKNCSIKNKSNNMVYFNENNIEYFYKHRIIQIEKIKFYPKNLTINFLDKFKNILNWQEIIYNCNLTKDIILKFKDYIFKQNNIEHLLLNIQEDIIPNILELLNINQLYYLLSCNPFNKLIQDKIDNFILPYNNSIIIEDIPF